MDMSHAASNKVKYPHAAGGGSRDYGAMPSVKWAPQRRRVGGSVLVLGLVMLLVISLITLATVSVPSVELKMARNTSLQAQALANAETHLVRGEERIQTDFGGIPRFDFNDEEQGCLQSGTVDELQSGWCDAPSAEATPIGAAPSGYRIQFLGPVALEQGTGNPLTDRYYFNVHGAGREDSGQRQVQSVYMTTELAP